MIFNLFACWNHARCCGFEFLGFDFYREDEMVWAFLGFGYEKDEKHLEIDFLWRCYEFNLKSTK